MITEKWDKQKINSKTFAIPILTASYLIDHYKTDAVRIGIANVLYNFLLIPLFYDH